MEDFASLYLLKNHMVAPRHMVEFVDTPCSFSSSRICPLLPSCFDSKVDIVSRGVFKKRAYFLNSAPTSTESALRLLSAPSVRF